MISPPPGCLRLGDAWPQLGSAWAFGERSQAGLQPLHDQPCILGSWDPQQRLDQLLGGGDSRVYRAPRVQVCPSPSCTLMASLQNRGWTGGDLRLFQRPSCLSELSHLFQ